MKTGLVILLPWLILWAAACNSGSAAATPTAPAVPVTVKADIKDFTHQTLNLKLGTTVVWTNRDGFLHTVTEDKGRFKSEPLDKDQSFSFTFSEVSTFGYFCEIHPFIRGTVTVSK